MNNYYLGAKFCRIVHRSGGVCIYIHESIQSSNIETQNYCKEKDFEACAVKLHLPTGGVSIVCLYRSPLGNFDYFLKELETILIFISRDTKRLAVCGDFNVNFDEDTPHRRSLISLLASFGLYGTVDFPTRIYNGASTTIDNIFINSITQNNVNVYPWINGLSDHDAQFIVLRDVKTSVDKRRFYTYRSFNKASVTNFNIQLSYESWEDVFASDEVNTCFNIFLNKYLTIFDASFPIRRSSESNKSKPWLTQGIKTSCYNKRKLYLESRHCKDHNKKLYYKRYCRVLNEVIQHAKKNYYGNLITNSNNKNRTTWKIINENINNNHQRQDISSISINGAINRNKQTIANKFNDYYSTVAHSLSVNINVSNTLGNRHITTKKLDNCKDFSPLDKLKFVSSKEIENVVKLLQAKESRGYDEISTKVIKQSIACIASPIAYICNLMMSSGIYLERLKFAEVKPLYKQGDRTDINNYRPISILPSFSKIFEKLIYTRLITYLDCNKILAKEQFGFRSHLSTELASYTLINDISMALNNKLLVGGIFCDLRKAFDCVDHMILLDKMSKYGIIGKTHKLITSYLENRYQRVVITDKLRPIRSEWKLIKQGVPQGSVLGPLLFLIYVNDFPSNTEPLVNTVLYADDTSVIVKSPSIMEFTDALQSSLINADVWFKNNSLTLNTDKTHLMQFCNKSEQPKVPRILCGNKQLNTVNNTKFLGLVIDSTLSWKQHVDSILPKLNKACFVMRSVKAYVTTDILRMLYFSHFHSVMTYGVIFWGNSVSSHDIFKIQKRAIRIMYNLQIRDSCRCAFKDLKILPFYSQYLYSLLMFVVKNRDLFQNNASYHPFNTRHKDDLHLPSTHLKTFQKGVLFSGTKAYNHLPLKLKELTQDVKRFKSALGTFFQTNSFYSIDEYYNYKSTLE